MHRLACLSALFAATLTLAVPAASSAWANGASLLGDLDGDQRISVRDVLSALQISAGVRQPTPREQFLGDVHPRPGSTRPVGDDRVTILDVVAILKVVAQLAPPDSLGNDQVQARLLPQTAFLQPGEQIRFDLLLVGPVTAAPVWSVPSGPVGGVVDQEGVYTAPPISTLSSVRVNVGPLELEALVVVDDTVAPPPPPE